jgi:polygalacturonase
MAVASPIVRATLDARSSAVGAALLSPARQVSRANSFKIFAPTADHLTAMSGADRRHFFRTLAGASAGLPALTMTADAIAESHRGAAAPRIFDVTQFGAVPDGRADSTAGVQRALDACAAAGGGLVLVPTGRYLCGGLTLRSHVHLHLGPGAVLLASQRFEDFPATRGRWEGIERTTYSSLLTGHDLEDVAITGQGVLDGQGRPWWLAHDQTLRLRAEQRLPRSAENPTSAPLRWPRPRLVNLIRCRRILVSGVELRDSPSYHLHFVYCQDVLVEGITAVSHRGPNTDGIVIDSTRRARILGCSISTTSDNIALKSGYNEEGRRANVPSEDVVITGCQLHGSLVGGVAIGSETSGGIRDVAVSNCLISGSTMGIHVRSPRGRGGTVERLRVSNVIMEEIGRSAITVSNYYDSVRNDSRGLRTAVDATSLKDIFDRPLPEAERTPPPPQRGNPETDRSMLIPVGEGTPLLRNFAFTGMTMQRVQAVAILEGLPERFLRDITISDVSISEARTGLFCWRVSNLRLSALSFDNSEGLAVTAQDVERLEIHRLSVASGGHRSVVQLENVDGAFIHGCDLAVAGPQYLRQLGDSCRGVVTAGNNSGEEG